MIAFAIGAATLALIGCAINGMAQTHNGARRSKNESGAIWSFIGALALILLLIAIGASK